MLMLNRKIGETICIGDDVKVTLCGIQEGAVVRIGIAAPKSVPVHREEIYQIIQHERRSKSEVESK